MRGEWLVDIAPHYFDLANFPQGECRRVLERCARRRILRLSCCRELPCAPNRVCAKMSDEICGICRRLYEQKKRTLEREQADKGRPEGTVY